MTRRRITAARDISRHPSAAGAPDDHPDTRGERHSAFRFVRSYEYCAQYLLSILDRHLLIYFAFITNSVLGSLLLEVVGPSVWISELNKYCYIALLNDQDAKKKKKHLKYSSENLIVVQ